MKKTSTIAVLTLAAFFAASAVAQDQSKSPVMKLEVGAVFAQGDYGLASDTKVWLVTAAPSLELPNWRLQVNIPYVRLDGPASVAGGTGTGSVNRSSSGLGDTSVSATYLFGTNDSGWAAELSAKVKFPTGDEAKGLGSGERDTAIQIDAYRPGGKIIPYFNVGYQFLGSNAAYRMESGFFATAGAVSALNAATTVGLLGSWREKTIQGGDQGVEAMVFVQHKMAPRTALKVFALKGFTDASPNFAGGVSVGWEF